MEVTRLCRRCARLWSQGASLTSTRVASRRAFTSPSAPKPLTLKPRATPSPTARQASTSTTDAVAESRTAAYDSSELLQNGRRTAPLRSGDLFHSFTKSPSPIIRQRAAVMRQNAYCPHPDHQATRIALSPDDTESRKTGSRPPAHVNYECPDCGIPVSCSEAHFADDYEQHLEVCDVLRQINEDDHDLISGRFFKEFDYPGIQFEESQINLTNWDTLLYTREFEAVDDERAMRQVTRLLTYPATIGSVLHELSPYSLQSGGRLTPEGLRSLSGMTTFCNPGIAYADILFQL